MPPVDPVLYSYFWKCANRYDSAALPILLPKQTVLEKPSSLSTVRISLLNSFILQLKGQVNYAAKAMHE